MKKINTILVMLLLLLTMFVSAPVLIADPGVIVSSYTLEPSVLMPGDSGILTLSIKNGETTATTTTSTSSTNGGYTSTTSTVKTNGAVIDNIWIEAGKDSNNNKVKAHLNYPDVGYLSAGSTINVDFEIVADEGITQGWYFPIIHIDLETYQDASFPISVFVSNSSVDLIAKEIPEKVSRSGSTSVTLSVVNNLGGSVEDVMVTPSASSGVSFVPASVFIGSMDSGSSEDVSFSVKSEDLGDKNFSFMVSFKNGMNVHKDFLNTSIEFIETLDVAPVVTNIFSTITKGSSTRINLEVYNAKNNEITGVIVVPVGDGTFVPSQYFIGSMDPDDVFSASFDYFTDGLDYGNYSLGFKVLFKQDNDYYETPAVNSLFSVIAGEVTNYQSTSNGQQSSSGVPEVPSLTTCIITIVVIIVVIILIVLFFMRRKKRHGA